MTAIRHDGRIPLGASSARALGAAAMLAAAVFSGTPVHAEGDGQVRFRARVGDLLLQAGHVARGLTREDTVEAVLPGELYEPPRRLAPVARDRADLGIVEGAVQADFSAWKADDAAWIRVNFAPGDQEDLSAFLDDAEIRAASRERFALYDSMFLWGVVRLDDHALALITYGQGDDRGRGLVATFVRHAGAWKRTNALKADETLDLVWAAFRVGEVRRRR
jgi:hypothetical protein